VRGAAIPTIILNDGGGLSSVTGLSIGSGTWDMTLHDGTFDNLLATAPSLPVYDTIFAHDASAALRDFFLTPSTFLPLDINKWTGCGVSNFDISSCTIGTAYAYDGSSSYFSGFTVDAFPFVAHEVMAFSGFQDVYLSDLTMATWECTSNCATVPEPVTLLLFCSGLLGIGIARRKAGAI